MNEIKWAIEKYFAKRNRDHTKISIFEKLYYTLIKSYPPISCRFCGYCEKNSDGELGECSIGICEREKWRTKQKDKIIWGK